MIVSICLLIYVRGHIFEGDLFDDTVIEAYSRCPFTVLYGSHHSCYRNDADGQDAVSQDGVHQHALASFELSDDGYGDLMILYLIDEVFGALQLLFGELIVAEYLTHFFCYIQYGSDHLSPLP